MKISIYDTELKRVLILENQFISCLWKEDYNNVGAFTLELQATAELKKIIRPDYFAGRKDRKTLMIIKTVEIKEDRLILSGKSALRALADIAFIGTVAKDTVIIDGLKTAYDKTDKAPLITIADSKLPDTYKNQISNKSMLDLALTMCRSTDIGIKAQRNKQQIEIVLYKPEPNSNLIFSKTYGNLLDEKIVLSTEQYKNYCIVLGAGEGDQRYRVNIDKTDGEPKRTIIVDSRDLQKEQDETDEQYLAKLQARGIEKLQETVKTWEVTFSPLAENFGTMFDLGDILTIRLTDYKMNITSRVMSFSQKEQNNEITTTVEVGQLTFKKRG